LRHEKDSLSKSLEIVGIKQIILHNSRKVERKQRILILRVPKMVSRRIKRSIFWTSQKCWDAMKEGPFEFPYNVGEETKDNF
jgi:hypothetical protein